MKVLITADWHLDLIIKGLERSDDILNSVSSMMDIAVSNDYSVFIILGDIISCTSVKRYPRYLDILMNKLKYLLEQGIRVIAISGNHDVVSYSNMMYPVTSISCLKHIGVELYEDITEFKIVGDSRKVIKCLAVPYLLSSFTNSKYGKNAQDYVDDKLKEILKDEFGYHLFSHLNIDGAMFGQEANVPRCGELFLSKFVEDMYSVDRIFNGHYHRPQTIRNKIIIPGSPERMDFGEQEDNKSFITWEV